MIGFEKRGTKAAKPQPDRAYVLCGNFKDRQLFEKNNLLFFLAPKGAKDTEKGKR